MKGAALCTLLVAFTANAVDCQRVPRVDPGWGIDTITAAWNETAWHASAVEIFTLWREYLLNDAHLQQPTNRWSSAEQAIWPAYDLTAGIAYKGMPATVLDIRPANPEATEFIVRTLFASRASDGVMRPVALTRVHAVREGGHWVFSNALPRATRDWRREIVRGVTYVMDRGVSFDRGTADQLAMFADSLARNLRVQPPGELTMIVASSPEALHDAMGIEWTLGGQGHGYTLPWNRLVFSGDPEFGQDNRHEIAHYVMAPILQSSRPHVLVVEGIPTWLGGSVGQSFTELQSEYADFLRERPEITLDRILERTAPDLGWNPAGAILVDMIFEHGGWPAINELVRAGRTDDDLRSITARLLDMPWSEVVTAWNSRARGIHE